MGILCVAANIPIRPVRRQDEHGNWYAGVHIYMLRVTAVTHWATEPVQYELDAKVMARQASEYFKAFYDGKIVSMLKTVPSGCSAMFHNPTK